MSATAAVVAPVIAPTGVPAAAEAAPAAMPDHKARARDLAGKFMAGAEAAVTETPAEAAPEAPAEEAAPEAPEAEAAPEEKKPADDAEAKAKAEALEKGFRELRRRQKQARELVEQKREFEATRARAAHDQRADEELKAKDPYAWLAKHGFDFRDVAKKAVETESKTPEQKAAEERDAKLSALEQELAEFRAERQARVQREALAEVTRETQAEWTSVSESYPSLAEHYSVEEITAAAVEIQLQYVRANKREPSLAAVFDHMEKNAKREAERFARRNAADPAKGSTERATVAGDKPEKTRAMGRPTVTNRDSSTRAAPTTPLTPEQRRARAAAKAREFLGSS